MATVTVKQNALVLNAFAATFQNNLVASDLVTWRQYDGEMNDRNGLQVIEQVPPRYVVTRTTDGIKDLTAGVQDSVFGSEIFKVNYTFGVSMGWADFVKVRDIDDARESNAIKAAATRLAEDIDGYILNIATLASNNWVQEAGGVNVADYDDIATAYTRLKKEGVDDSDLRLALTFDDRQALAATIIGYSSTDDGLSTYRKGFEGEINGLPTMFTQQTPTLTVGTRAATGAAQVSGGSQNVNYSSVATSTSPGYYMSATLSVKNMTAGHTIKDGEVFTIAGIYAYDNRLQAQQGHLQQFRVIGDQTADGSGLIAAMRYFPAMIIGDSDVNSAHRTVSAAPANSTAISFIGTASTAYKPRLLIQKEAIVVNTVDLPASYTDTQMRKSLTKVPMSVRMWKHSDFATGAHSVRFDCALTANVRDRRRIVRLNGVA